MFFFVVPLWGLFYPSKNEKNSPKPHISVNIYAYPTEYAGSKKFKEILLLWYALIIIGNYSSLIASKMHNCDSSSCWQF